MTDRSGGASLLPYTPSRVTASTDDNDDDDDDDDDGSLYIVSTVSVRVRVNVVMADYSCLVDHYHRIITIAGD